MKLSALISVYKKLIDADKITGKGVERYNELVGEYRKKLLISTDSRRVIRARNCDSSDTQNYYLTTEIDGNVPQIGNTYCSDPNQHLDDVTGPCNQEMLRVEEIVGPAQPGAITYPKNSQGQCQ